MTQEIDVLIVEPGKAPRPAKVLNTMEAFEEVVGGPIEIGAYLPQRVMLIFNSATKDYIEGTFLLCSFEDRSFTSLTREQRTEFQTHFAEPGELMLAGTVCANRDEAAMASVKLWDSMKNGEYLTLTRWGALDI